MNVYLASPHGNYFLNAYKERLMDIYLAGAATGNNNAIWRNNANNPKQAFKELKIDDMDIYLAGTYSSPCVIPDTEKIFVLESFYYIQEWMEPYIKEHWNFMLDSGAFTFMSNKQIGINIDWDKYVERYANYINKLDVKLFFELDIDSIIGLKEVERLRAKLEKLTGKQSIPVWHKSRGLEYWKKMVKDYDYVSIGGIVSKEIKSSEFGIFNPLLKIAKENNCKVHALGFTNQQGVKRYKFDSVDSTAWIYGNIGGYIYQFTGREIIQIHKPPNTRLKSKKVAIHNFKEWVKFQKYAYENL